MVKEIPGLKKSPTLCKCWCIITYKCNLHKGHVEMSLKGALKRNRNECCSLGLTKRLHFIIFSSLTLEWRRRQLVSGAHWVKEAARWLWRNWKQRGNDDDLPRTISRRQLKSKEEYCICLPRVFIFACASIFCTLVSLCNHNKMELKINRSHQMWYRFLYFFLKDSKPLCILRSALQAQPNILLQCLDYVHDSLCEYTSVNLKFLHTVLKWMHILTR